jgi:hypothetical protein
MLRSGQVWFARMDDEFRIEKGLAKTLGFANGFPSSNTIYRFLGSFNGYHIRQLERINLEVLKEHKEAWYSPKGPVFLDLDMNVKSGEGKQERAVRGFNRKRKGRRSLKWSVGYASKVALYSEIDAGNTSERIVLERQVEELEKLLGRLDLGEDEQRLIFRVDGGYFSWENLAFMNRRKFMIRLPHNLELLKPYREADLKWRKYSQASDYADLGKVHFSQVDTGVDFRVVLLRIVTNGEVELYP